MANETTRDDMDNQDVLNAELNLLKQASARFLILGTQAYKAGEPESYAQMKTLFNKGLIEIGITVHLTPRLYVECWASGPDGQKHVFATQTAREITGNGPALN